MGRSKKDIVSFEEGYDYPFENVFDKKISELRAEIISKIGLKRFLDYLEKNHGASIQGPIISLPLNGTTIPQNYRVVVDLSTSNVHDGFGIWLQLPRNGSGPHSTIIYPGFYSNPKLVKHYLSIPDYKEEIFSILREAENKLVKK